ncbi:3-oxoacyl-[acyl-carrier-protein] synthase III C-terminal domain-containing protein [Shewanella algae]|uniref:3-oxoacyl-[acyl-carrier-protein] synthase III C-terminal domain-containing protein n=1 Tax=Shewanella algae TaxID=38313 RepID=UPI0016843455|nr:3-oxoacyl-[acyl-carrier-protein] synthase III C-terminal domain-containing protein [Shewanella algae]MBO2631461.1 hypothetical protein [Shewanella algae]QNV04196.1 ketoacyl-ACP synthase III [Shewanella algae]
MLKGISIKKTGIYHPSKQLDNTYFIEHFDKQDKSVASILEKTGRKLRYQIEGTEENSLTMAIEAAKIVLQRAHLSASDIDIIVFISTTPEMLSPTNALMIHKVLSGKEDTLCFDLNGNCIGMFIAVEQVTRTLKFSNKNRALIIGSDFNNLLADPQNPITYSIFGDAAVALILEKDGSNSELMDVEYQSRAEFVEEIVFPPKGLSRTLRENESGRYLYWGDFDGIDSVNFAVDSIPTILKKHGLSINDIALYCFSQFTQANIIAIQEQLELAKDTVIYIGDNYGYTGNSSPFLALHQAIENGKVSRGDYIVFWTLGSGYQAGTMLWRY